MKGFEVVFPTIQIGPDLAVWWLTMLWMDPAVDMIHSFMLTQNAVRRLFPSCQPTLK